MYFTKETIDYRDHLDGTYSLLEDLVLITSDWQRILVPKGYRCNGSSIPRFFWRVCGAPNDPQNIRAGFVHDYCYGNKLYGRKECDKLFEKILVKEGKPRLIAWGMYGAVRAFGGSHY